MCNALILEKQYVFLKEETYQKIYPLIFRLEPRFFILHSLIRKSGKIKLEPF